MKRRILTIILGLVFAYGALGYLTLRLRWLPGVEPNRVEGAVAFGPGRTLAGVTSVHTEHSHDATGTVTDLSRSARSAGLDFVLIGDHPPGRDPWEPAIFRDSVLIAFGLELVFPDVGRGLVFGMADPLDIGLLQTEAMWSFLDDPDATAVVIHGRAPRERERWIIDEAAPMHGWEVMDVSESARRALASPWNVYHAVSLVLGGLSRSMGESLLRLDRLGFDGPSVAAYDSMTLSAPLTALAGLNHHPKSVFRGRPFPDYGPFFETLVNHVLVDTVWVSAEEKLRVLGSAIRRGEVFISVGAATNAAGFRFAVVDGDGGMTSMGGETALEPGLRLATTGPAPPRGSLVYRVIRDGQEIGWHRAPALSLQIDQPGVYRVEAHRYRWRLGSLYYDLRPWIFANPIRVGRAEANPTTMLEVIDRAMIPMVLRASH